MTMTSHELARELLAQPDGPVTISIERDDESRVFGQPRGEVMVEHVGPAAHDGVKCVTVLCEEEAPRRKPRKKRVTPREALQTLIDGLSVLDDDYGRGLEIRKLRLEAGKALNP